MPPESRPLRFALAITCLDGRVQRPVVEYLRRKYGVDYVDLITEPGPEHALTEPTRARVQAAIHRNAKFSVDGHDAELIAVTAHDDCLGNSADIETRLRQLKAAQAVVSGWDLGVDVVALWVHGTGKVEEAATAVPSLHKTPPTFRTAPGPAAAPNPAGGQSAPATDDEKLISGVIGFALGIAAERKRSEH